MGRRCSPVECATLTWPLPASELQLLVWEACAWCFRLHGNLLLTAPPPQVSRPSPPAHRPDGTVARVQGNNAHDLADGRARPSHTPSVTSTATDVSPRGVTAKSHKASFRGWLNSAFDLKLSLCHGARAFCHHVTNPKQI